MDNLRLAYAACRIGFYRLTNRITGRVPPPSKPHKHVVCIGLNNSGKSAALSLAAGEQIDQLQPTEGFHIKDVELTDCILTVKEIGGSEKIRKYWSHYYKGAQGVIFVVDGAGEASELETARAALVEAMDDPQLSGLPILLLVTHQDVERTHPKSANEMSELWGLKELYPENISIYSTSIKHIGQLKAAFNAFGNILVHGTTSPTDVQVS
ncbi:ADP-ribosylation factor-like protein 15 [Watersipora subatra]|uniref:ADP-ribosylation factor-like protein 15 n=1 Tax=Watersipora subatra TaxID=2589382 RepID=UPI00355C2938